jgi:hypothetical protein
MSFFKYIVTKTNPSEPWIIAQAPYAEACCTEEEMSSIIVPFRANVSALPGYTTTDVTEIDSTTISVSYNFDSDSNRDNAIIFLHEISPHKALMVSKREVANIIYTAEIISG